MGPVLGRLALRVQLALLTGANCRVEGDVVGLKVQFRHAAKKRQRLLPLPALLTSTHRGGAQGVGE